MDVSLNFEKLYDFKTSAMKGAVTDFDFATSSGVPEATIWPPVGPASGPRSMR